MSEKHLAKGSSCPPLAEGKLRLYSMLYCPYAQRTRLILVAKNIPHDIVNVNLKEKPEWLLEKNSAGKVPLLEESGGKLTPESIDIAEYLNEKYPDPPLHSSDPEHVKADQELMKQFDKVIEATNNAIRRSDNRPAESYMNDIVTELEVFEKELASRGTTFFGGDRPGMLDYIIWPWSERARLPAMIGGEEFKPQKGKFPSLVKWKDAMKEDKAVKACFLPPEAYYKFYKTYLAGQPEYDVAG